MRDKTVYLGLIDLEKMCDKVNRKVLRQVLRMYDVGGKLLSGIKNTNVDSSACVRVKGGESEGFTIDSEMRHGCIMSPWLFNIYMDEVMKEVKMGMRMRGDSGYCLASCMHMTWFYVVSWMGT